MLAAEMVTAIVIGILVFAGCAIAGRRKGLWAWATAAFAGAAIAGAAAHWQAESKIEWNSVRAVIPVGIVRGVQPYAVPGSGPLWCNIYPPGAFWVQSVIAVARTPQGAIRLGQALSTIWMGVPLVLLARRAGASWHMSVATLPLLAGAVLACPPLADAVTIVHVDGVAIGFALLALAMVVREAPSRREALLAGVACAAAIGCKQTLLAVPVALGAWLAWRAGRRAFATFAGAFAMTGGAVLIAAAAQFGLAPVWHCVVVVPSKHEFPGGFASAAGDALGRAGTFLWPLLAAWVVAVLGAERKGRAMLCLAIAIAQLPLSMLGYMKFGGGQNNFAYAAAFVFAGAVVAMAQSKVRWSRRALLACAGALGGAHALAPQTRADLAAPSPHVQSYAAIRSAPGRYFFPWYPLSHLMGENRVTHFGWGVIDRVAAGEPMTEVWFRSGVPPDARYLCFRTPPDKFDLPYHYLAAEYPRRVDLPELPGWTCFERAGP